MDLQTMLNKVFSVDVPECYEITKLDLSVAAADSPEGGKIYFRGGSDAAKITLEKKQSLARGYPEVRMIDHPAYLSEKKASAKLVHDRLYYCPQCEKNYGRRRGQMEVIIDKPCKECADAEGTEKEPEEEKV